MVCFFFHFNDYIDLRFSTTHMQGYFCYMVNLRRWIPRVYKMKWSAEGQNLLSRITFPRTSQFPRKHHIQIQLLCTRISGLSINIYLVHILSLNKYAARIQIKINLFLLLQKCTYIYIQKSSMEIAFPDTIQSHIEFM